ESIAVEEGQTVVAGDPIMTLALDERASRLAEAEARLEQRQADYDAGISLQEKGYATAERIRELRSALEEARAEVATIEQQVADTTILAPFDGVVDEIERRVGEVVELGEEVATLIDNAPLRVEVRGPQQSISRVEVGAPADVQYATGAREAGRVCVISVAADSGTRTFRVEVRTPNADRSIPSGISAEVRIPTGEIEAHFLTPAILSLNDDGRLGVKTVSPQNTVQFHTVSIVQARADGIWVTGLPEEARVITVGQGFVRAGDAVALAEAGEGAAGAVVPEAASSPADAADLGPDLARVSPPDASICEVPDRARASVSQEVADAEDGAEPGQ
ncbi:MAG TPA: efflux RND transporter periplasmic adaptor subunit, partial [Thermohalobaculum sp.]|nr:efflux RND transporter periplasmic adaptor subunit [Thermohalobaculum sp.]